MSDAFVQPELEMAAEPPSDSTARPDGGRPPSDPAPPHHDLAARSAEPPVDRRAPLFIVFDEFVPSTPQVTTDLWCDVAPHNEVAFHIVLRASRHRKPRPRRERRRWGVRKPLVRYGS